jgi:hypothetical protein
MANKTPIRAVFNDSNVATGLAEFQSGDTIALTHGGLGASLSIGSAGQVLKVNSGASALEFGFVEAVVNIDNATNLTSATLASSDLFLVSDGGTEGRATLAQIQAAIKDTTATLTNKTISGSSNTLSNIGNSSLSNSAVTVGSTSISLGSSSTTIAGLTSVTSGTVNIADRHIKTTDSTNLVLNEAVDISSAGAITGGSLNLSGNAVVSGNLTVSGTTTTLETTNSVISDKLIELATGTSGTPSGDVGIVGERGSQNNIFFGFDESADEFTVGTGTFTGATTGDLSITKGTFSSAGNRIYNGSDYVALVSPSLGGANVTLTLPANDGDSNQVLITDGSGNLSFSSVSAASGAGLSNIVEDTSPQLGGNLDVQTNNIVSTSNRSISILPNGSGKVLLDGNGSSGGVAISDGLVDIFTGTGSVSKVKFYCESSNAHAQTLQAQPHSASSSAVLTLPVATGTLIGTGDSGTVSNTMLANNTVSISDDSSTAVNVPLGGGFTILGGSGITTALNGSEMTIATDGGVVTETSTDTLTNKSLNFANNTFTTTLAQLQTAVSDATLVDLDDSQTLTNKSIDSDNNTITNIVNADIKSSAAIAFSKMADLTASRALVSDSSGDVSVSAVTSTEIGYLDGVSSAIQTQLDNKAAKSFAIAQAVALG